MQSNENVLQGEWKNIKGEIQKAWGKLTGDELEQTKGNLKSIGGLIQEKYGMKQEEISEKLKGLCDKFIGDTSAAANDATYKIKTELRK